MANTSDWDKKQKECIKKAKKWGKPAALIGDKKGKYNYGLLRVIELDDFFSAEEVQIFYVAFP